jgi:hypothetical protein
MLITHASTTTTALTGTSLPVTSSSSSGTRLGINDVWRIGSAPSAHNEVDRTASAAMKNIAALILRAGRITSIYQGSKTGKTCLVRRLVRGSPVIDLHAVNCKTKDQFWAAVAEAVAAPRHTKVNVEATRETAAETEVGGHVKAGMLGIKAKLGGELSTTSGSSETTSIERDFGPITPRQLTSYLTAKNAVVLLDDAHQVDLTVQVEILKDLRPFLNNGGRVIWCSVPERACRALTDANDLELAALTTVIRAPEWTHSELVEIGRRGFQAMGLDVPEPIISKIAHGAHLNPFLMQSLCWHLCHASGVLEQQVPPRPLVPTTKELRSVFKQTAKETSFPTYQEIATAGDRTWRLQTGQPVSVRTLLLLATKHINFNQEIGIEKLVDRVAGLLGPSAKAPDKGVLKRALQTLSNDLAERYGHNAPFEYDPVTQRAHFLVPFFHLYVAWELAPQFGEPEPI